MKRSLTALAVLFIFLIVVILMVINTPAGLRIKSRIKFNIEDLNFDEHQMLIYNLISQEYKFVGVPFITYELLDTDNDTHYDRFYILALIEDIDKDYTVHNSLLYPFAFVYDRDKGSLIRTFYPNVETTIAEIEDNFSLTARQRYWFLSTEAQQTRLDKMHSTNIWNAETFFGVKNTDIDYE